MTQIVTPQPAPPTQVRHFDPRQHLINLKGKDYLPVAARLVWVNEDCERNSWSLIIETEFLNLDDTVAIARAIVTLADRATGQIIKKTSATKRQTKTQFADFTEKAETGAIGRAVGILGYGAQFDDEFDETSPKTGETRVVDKPQARGSKPSSKPKKEPISSDRFSDGQIKRTMAIAGKLFSLSGDELLARVIEAGQKILGSELTDEEADSFYFAGLEALHWRHGKKIMATLEEEAIKRGLWKKQEEQAA